MRTDFTIGNALKCWPVFFERHWEDEDVEVVVKIFIVQIKLCARDETCKASNHEVVIFALDQILRV